MLSARLFALTAFFLSTIASPVPSDPPQPDHPPWDQVYIKGFKYAGTGCPAGSVEGSLASNGSFFSIAYNSFVARAGPGISITENKKNCQLTLELHYPSEWSLTVSEARYEGYIKLDNKVTAKQQSTYRWAGQTPAASFYSAWVGPIDKTYSFTDKLDEKKYVWSSCNGISGSLIISTQIYVENSKNPKASVMLPEDQIDNKVIQIYGSRWRRCSVHVPN